MRYGEFAVHVDRLFVKPEGLVGKTLHAAVGISGEVAELQECLNRWNNGEGFDYENIKEECGDILFYAQAFCSLHSVSMSSLIVEDAETDNLHLSLAVAVACSGKFLDRVKKTWIYSKEFDVQEAVKHLRTVLYEVVALLRYSGSNVQQAFQENYDKLKLRYPDGYTDQAAQLRADKAGVE
mgnify:CR=1 FL=1|jgi:NTP pyrophosphatase (non-canonical NTP hydrolase)